jgi:hypothetical protein
MFSEDRKSKNKIKRGTHIYWHQLNTQLKWGDIKHLQLEDNDLIYSAWEENEDNNGNWEAVITRMVEETDEQFQKRMKDVELKNKWAKEQRYSSYLKLKDEFENDKK